jgi:hypothetical protein
MAAPQTDNLSYAGGRSSADQLPGNHAGTLLGRSDGRNTHLETGWEVSVYTTEHTVTRTASLHGQRGTVQQEREEVIWPTWPATTADEAAVHGALLADLQQYWSTAGDRLRESAKWMATVLVAALAAIIGTSPLAKPRDHLQVPAAAIGGAGLIFLGVTMFLVLRVMRPQAVTYAEVQDARPLRSLARMLPKRLRRHWRHSHRWMVQSGAQSLLNCRCPIISEGFTTT